MMTLSLAGACLWFVIAAILAAIPSNDHHWRRAYVLIAVGIPLIGWVTFENGPWIGLMVLAAGCSVLRWPMLYLYRWVRKVVVRS